MEPKSEEAAKRNGPVATTVLEIKILDQWERTLIKDKQKLKLKVKIFTILANNHKYY